MVVLVCAFKVALPFAYNDEIEFYSKKYKIDEPLIRAIIKVESGYDSLAKSDSGAIGLMQIMPTTAHWVSEELGFGEFSEEQLLDPKTNIQFGCFYLSYYSFLEG